MNEQQFNQLLQSYPELCGRLRGGETMFVPFDRKLAETLAGSAYVIPLLADDSCLMTRRDNGKWVLPGGTIEPDETWEAAAHRELMEETGSRLLNLNPFGMYRCVSQDPEPRLPHIPHPVHYRVLSWSDVERVGTPEDPAATAKIAEVRAVSLEDAQNLFDQTDTDFSALYRLASSLKNSTQTVNLREAEDTDSGFCCRTREAAFRKTAEEVRGWDEEREESLHQARFASQRFRIIQYGGRDVGILSTEATPDCLKVYQFFILPEHQSRGIGSAILQTLISEGEELRLPLWLQVLKGNERAMAFYLRHGFETVGETDTHTMFERCA